MPLYGDGRSGTFSATVTQFGGYQTPLSSTPAPAPSPSRLLTTPPAPPAPLTLNTNSFEGVADSTALTAANSGGASGTAFDSVLNASSIALAKGTSARAGSRGLEIVRSSSTQLFYADWNAVAGSTTGAVRFYFRMNTMPAANFWPLAVLSDAGGNGAVIYLDSSNNVALWTAGGNVVSTVAAPVTTGQWYRVEVAINLAGGATQFALYSGDSTTAIGSFSGTAAFGATTFTLARFLFFTSLEIAFGPATGSFSFDDLAFANQATLIGPAVSAPTASGAITLDGTATGIATPVAATASGSLSLGGSATAASPVTASGSISLGGSSSAQARSTTTGTVTLGGVSTATITASAAGSLALGGTASATITATASGSITLGSTSTARGAATAAGTVTLGGTAIPNAAPTAATATGSITLTGSTTARAGGTASGVIVLGGSSTATAGITAVGAVTLGGSGAARAVVSSAGTIVLGGAITARVPATTAGLITLSGLANGVAADYAPHVYVTATVAFTPATATLAGDGTSTAALTKPSGFGEAFGEAFGGWQTTVTAAVTGASATAVLAGDGTSTAAVATNGISTAVLSEVPALAELQLV